MAAQDKDLALRLSVHSRFICSVSVCVVTTLLVTLVVLRCVHCTAGGSNRTTTLHILYSTPAVTSLLQLALHQSLLRNTMAQQQSARAVTARRKSYNSDKGEGGSWAGPVLQSSRSFQVIILIALCNLKAIRVRCLDNERVCIQGTEQPYRLQYHVTVALRYPQTWFMYICI
jgi:hypothetical protein